MTLKTDYHSLTLILTLKDVGYALCRLQDDGSGKHPRKLSISIPYRRLPGSLYSRLNIISISISAQIFIGCAPL